MSFKAMSEMANWKQIITKTLQFWPTVKKVAPVTEMGNARTLHKVFSFKFTSTELAVAIIFSRKGAPSSTSWRNCRLNLPCH